MARGEGEQLEPVGQPQLAVDRAEVVAQGALANAQVLRDHLARSAGLPRDGTDAYGVPLEQALEHLCERVPLTSVRYFTVAVLIQRTAGGNLTKILGGLSRLLRQRVKLLDRIHVLSAEGRLSAWILVVLPFALAGLLYVINPQCMGPLWQDPIGRSMVQVLLTMMGVGGMVMRRIIKIRV